MPRRKPRKKKAMRYKGRNWYSKSAKKAKNKGYF